MWGFCDLGDARLPYLAGAFQQSVVWESSLVSAFQQSVVWESSLVCVFLDAFGCAAMTELYA